jgi:hypothetical protein
MATELLFEDMFELVHDAVYGAIIDCGFTMRPDFLGLGSGITERSACWAAQRGSRRLATLLPFLFEHDSVSVVVREYRDGRTGVILRSKDPVRTDSVTRVLPTIEQRIRARLAVATRSD